MNLMSLSSNPDSSPQTGHHKFDWNVIDQVFLDMDGTLLDKHFDDYFWEQYVVHAYADKNDLSIEKAREVLLQTYKSVENTLAWTDLDYWSERLDLDIPELKKEIGDLIGVLPHADLFLRHMELLGKDLYLITNAHPKALAIKLERVKIEHHFTKIICSQDVGAAKEQIQFWDKLQQFVRYDIKTTLFIDDTERVLASARQYGFHNLVHIAKASSQAPVCFSKQFPSISHLGELISHQMVDTDSKSE